MNMVVAEVLSQHIFNGSSVIISVDDGQLEGYAHGIDDIVDEAPSLITPHTM